MPKIAIIESRPILSVCTRLDPQYEHHENVLEFKDRTPGLPPCLAHSEIYLKQLISSSLLNYLIIYSLSPQTSVVDESEDWVNT